MRASEGRGLAARFAAHLRGRGVAGEGDALVVALSGGADSVVLLHLLRFTAGLPRLTLTAAHLDHAMRPDAGADARWVAGLCRAWGVPLTTARLEPAPAGEAEARRRRYAFLEDVRRREGAAWVVTAHHADDQAETVLFRMARGTGLEGLQGIREHRSPGVWRPLLPFTREELRRYAREQRLSWREDATNLLPMARNVLRHRVLPEMEARVAPSVRTALAGLAAHARADEAAWRSVEALLLEGVDLRCEEAALTVDRAAFIAHHEAVRARLLRSLARRLGGALSRVGTSRGVAFTTAGSSGASVPLGGGLTLLRELDRLRVARAAPRPPDRSAQVALQPRGAAEAAVGGVIFKVTWERGPGGGKGWEASFGADALAFPLTVRGWRPGDRIRLSYGTKKLKKLLLEARVPRSRRHATPVVVDARGRVVWIPGVARAAGTEPRNDEDRMTIGIAHADAD